MHLIVNISELQYEAIMKSKVLKDVKADYIRNAIVLPKGHGRLIDADALIKKGDITKDYLNIFAPTVIEADKEGN